MIFADYYLALKAAHIVFVIYWMAGLFMLPRYLAYHAEAQPGSTEDSVWQEREAKLSRIILMPAMLITWLLGLTLAWGLGSFTSPWLVGKLLLVAGLTALQILLARWSREFRDGSRRRSSRFFRMVNEIPGIAIIAIVVLVVLKPFA